MLAKIEPQENLLYNCATNNCHPQNLSSPSLGSSLCESRPMEDQRELQLLPTPSTRRITGWALGPPVSSKLAVAEPVEVPSLDLQLSINHQPIRRTSDFMQKRRPVCKNGDAKIDLSRIEALRWHSAEQIRLAAIEKAYAEQIRELTKREMELAQSEFVRARLIWKKVQEDVENAERQKARATHQIDSSCMEITCQACQQRFRP